MNKLVLWLALLTIPLYGFWIIPQNAQADQKVETISALEAETKDYQEKIIELKDLDKLLSDERFDGVLERIPPTLEQETFILLLQRIAESSGFVFDSLSFSRGQDAAIEANTLDANFSVKGRADRFVQFLETIEKSPRFMGISNFSYSTENINGIGVVTMSVPLYTFAQSSEN